MRSAVVYVLALTAALTMSVPAYASSTVSLPEPGSLTLLALGIIGVVVGRHVSRKPPQD